MKYDNNSFINNMEGVKTFFSYLTNERNLLWNPDEDFKAFVDEKAINIDEALLYNRLMDECFRVCGRNKKDIYEVCIKIQSLKKEALEANCKKIAEKKVLKRGVWIDAEKYKPTDIDGYRIGDYVAYIICYDGDEFKYDAVTGWWDNYNGNCIPKRFPNDKKYTIKKFCVLPKITNEVLGEEE